MPAAMAGRNAQSGPADHRCPRIRRTGANQDDALLMPMAGGNCFEEFIALIEIPNTCNSDRTTRTVLHEQSRHPRAAPWTRSARTTRSPDQE